jgi:excisionase family DNA binding protein
MEQIIVTTPSELRALIAEECERLYSRLAENKEGKSEEPEMISAGEAAQYLTSKGYRISKSSIESLTSTGEIPFVKFGRKTLYSRGELMDWAESRIHRPYTSRQNQARALAHPRKRA